MTAANVFAATFEACQQLGLLGFDLESAAAQAVRDFGDVGVVAFLQEQQADLRRAGHKAEVIQPGAGTAAASLRWRLAGRTAHPRDAYTLALQLDGDRATARFQGPARNTQALVLTTRTFNPDTLTRWTMTFYEWALTTRETR